MGWDLSFAHRIEVIQTSTFRQFLIFVLLFSVFVTILFGAIYNRVAEAEGRRIDELISTDVNILSREPVESIIYFVNHRVTGDYHHVAYAGLFDRDERFVAGNLVEIPADLKFDGSVSIVTAKPTDGTLTNSEREPNIRAAARRLEDGRILVIGRNGNSLTILLSVVSSSLLIGSIPAWIVALSSGIYFSYRTQLRAKNVYRAVERIMNGHIGERLPIFGQRDELDKLASLVNRMLDEIERLMREIKATGDDIAHDLRTPLTRVRARLERSLRPTADAIELRDSITAGIAGLDQALAVVTGLLRIRELENDRRQFGFTDVDLSELVLLIDELYQPTAEMNDLTLRSTAPQSCRVLGDRDLLMEALGNLVDNAIKFVPRGGVIDVLISQEDGATILTVVDTGPGIAPEERELVFNRFYRSEKARHIQGTGLGLSLVAAIAKLHRAEVRIRNEMPGCKIDFIFPNN